MKIKVGIAGAAGYTGGELLRLLLGHEGVEITSAWSKSAAGKKLYSVHHDLLGRTEACFDGELSKDLDVLFLCLGHGESRTFLETQQFPESLRIIDLSQDFRHAAHSIFKDRHFVYGLPELNREAIKSANSIANPGCFATAIQLALLPLAEAGKLKGTVHVNATTGSTGAGQALSASTHFTWRNNNLSAYKVFTHQHLTEIKEGLSISDNAAQADIQFVPLRGAFTRGIFASVSVCIDEGIEELLQVYENYYASQPFTHIAPFEVDLKQVVNTNFCYLHLQKEGNWLHVVSVIDNLIKGASGQAIQNMNIAFGLDEMTGLNLKASAF